MSHTARARGSSIRKVDRTSHVNIKKKNVDFILSPSSWQKKHLLSLYLLPVVPLLLSELLSVLVLVSFLHGPVQRALATFQDDLNMSVKGISFVKMTASR